MQLRIPGPTPCPPEVLQVMSKQMINHRGKEFCEIVADVTEKLKKVFQTKNDVLLLTGSGTGGMEATIVNMLSPGDKVLSVSNGSFGDRFAAIAETYGAKVNRLAFEWGRPIDAEAVRQALKDDPEVKAVLITHNETSTGMTNDLATLNAIIKEFDKLILVDAISGLGAIDLQVDNWNCDVAITGSQKAWMVPPGLAMVSVSDRAWKAHAEAKIPRFYWDFTRAKTLLEKKQTPWTPAVPIFPALQVALNMILAEGVSNLFARHARVSAVARSGVKSLGLSLFADERYASNTITAIKAPSDKFDVNLFRNRLRDEYGIELAGGQGKLAGKIFRIGHLGWVEESDMKEVLDAMAKLLPQMT